MPLAVEMPAPQRTRIRRESRSQSARRRLGTGSIAKERTAAVDIPDPLALSLSKASAWFDKYTLSRFLRQAQGERRVEGLTTRGLSPAHDTVLTRAPPATSARSIAAADADEGFCTPTRICPSLTAGS